MNRAIKSGVLNPLADALLAFQFQERDPDGRPSLNARLGATFMAEMHLMFRAYMSGGGEP